MQYENRYFAFADILGFSNLIRQSKVGSLEVKEIHDLLKVVHKPTGKYKIQNSAVRAQSISISAKASEGGLRQMLGVLRDLSFRLLERGYFVRGGLVKGELVHLENAVLGPARLDVPFGK